MEFKIEPSSPEILRRIELEKQGLHASTKHAFPWETIEVGQSFAVPLTYIELHVLRALVAGKNKRRTSAKRYQLQTHPTCYEVARVA